MRRDEHAAVHALVDAVEVLGMAVSIQSQARAWSAVDGAVADVATFLGAPADEDARHVHGEPPSYFLEIKGNPPDEPMDGEDPDGWESPGCGYETADMDEAMGMLRWAIGAGKPRRIVHGDHVYTVVREVSGDFPAD